MFKSVRYQALIVLLLCHSAFALTAPANCNNLNEIKAKLNAHSSNIMNANTTRDNSGSFYKKKVVRDCQNGKCHVIVVNRFLKRYEPNHPDADSTGYVKYPDINKDHEMQMLAKQVKKLKRLAKRKVCQTKLYFHRKNKNIFKVKYTNDSIADIFHLDGNRVSSWTVDSPIGKNTLTF